MAILQHHDGVSGIERQHVADDYAVRLSRVSIEVEDVMKSALVYLMSGNQNCQDTISTVVKTNAKRHKAYLVEGMDLSGLLSEHFMITCNLSMIWISIHGLLY